MEWLYKIFEKLSKLIFKLSLYPAVIIYNIYLLFWPILKPALRIVGIGGLVLLIVYLIFTNVL